MSLQAVYWKDEEKLPLITVGTLVEAGGDIEASNRTITEIKILPADRQHTERERLKKLGRRYVEAGRAVLSQQREEDEWPPRLGTKSPVSPADLRKHFQEMTLRAVARWVANEARVYCDTGNPAYAALVEVLDETSVMSRITWFSVDPMADLTMRIPQTLPRVPSDEDVRRLLIVCPRTFEGERNRAMITLLADSGLRKEEARRLRVGDVDLASRMIRVQQGKGLRDGVAFIGGMTASALRSWLAVHPDRRPEAFLLVSKDGSPLGPWAIVRILHRISWRARLERPVGPHALRHYAATVLLRRTGDLELVRRVLRHSTLAMALRYATLTQTEIAAKFAAASPMDRLSTRQQIKRARSS
jgi:integrase